VNVDMGHATVILEDAITCFEQKNLPDASEECEYCRWVENVNEKSLSATTALLKTKRELPVPEETETEEETKDTLF